MFVAGEKLKEGKNNTSSCLRNGKKKKKNSPAPVACSPLSAHLRQAFPADVQQVDAGVAAEQKPPRRVAAEIFACTSARTPATATARAVNHATQQTHPFVCSFVRSFAPSFVPLRREEKFYKLDYAVTIGQKSDHNGIRFDFCQQTGPPRRKKAGARGCSTQSMPFVSRLLYGSRPIAPAQRCSWWQVSGT